MGQSLDAPAEDHNFLLFDNVFSQELITKWIRGKRKEVEELRSRLYPFETEKYFNV